MTSRQRINEMNNNVLNFLLFNGHKDTFEDLYRNTDSQMDLAQLLNKQGSGDASAEPRGDSDSVAKMYRSQSFQSQSSLRRVRSNSGTQLSTSAVSRRRKSSFRHLDLQKQDGNAKVRKMLAFKKGALTRNPRAAARGANRVCAQAAHSALQLRREEVPRNRAPVPLFALARAVLRRRLRGARPALGRGAGDLGLAAGPGLVLRRAPRRVLQSARQCRA